MILEFLLLLLPQIIFDNLEDGIIVGNVSHIVDGDTLDLSTGDRIRLSLVNTPERGEQGYKEAKSYLSSLCLDKQTIIDLDNGQEDSYGRLIGWIDRCGDDENINKILIEKGYAKLFPDPKFCKISEFKERLC